MLVQTHIPAPAEELRRQTNALHKRVTSFTKLRIVGGRVLDGTQTQGPDVLSLSRANTEVHSVELFTDGYMSCPVGSSVRDWEDEFFRVEAEDF